MGWSQVVYLYIHHNLVIIVVGKEEQHTNLVLLLLCKSITNFSFFTSAFNTNLLYGQIHAIFILYHPVETYRRFFCTISFLVSVQYFVSFLLPSVFVPPSPTLPTSSKPPLPLPHIKSITHRWIWSRTQYTFRTLQPKQIFRFHYNLRNQANHPLSMFLRCVTSKQTSSENKATILSSRLLDHLSHTEEFQGPNFLQSMIA